MSDRVLITGANGFVGVNLVRQFGLAASDVYALDVGPPDALATWFLSDVSHTVTHVVGDLRKETWAQDLGDVRFDLVIHAAALTPLARGVEMTHGVDAVEVNIGGTGRLMEWAAQTRPRRVVYVSSGSVYGGAIDPDGLKEDLPHSPASVYGITKSAAERLALRLGVVADLDVIAVRLTQPYGPMERVTQSRAVLSPVHDWCRAAVTGHPIEASSLDLVLDFAHISDVVGAIHVLAGSRDLSHRVYNVSTGVAIRLRDVLDLIRQSLPEISIVEGSWEPSPGGRRSRLDVTRLTGDTGWRPRHTLESGIAQYIGWLDEALAVGEPQERSTAQ